MLIKTPSDIDPSEITDRKLYLNRRLFLRGGAALAVGSGLGLSAVLAGLAETARAGARLDGVSKGPYRADDALTPPKDVTRYNNFYEFATDKAGPAELAKNFRTRPWTVAVEGEVAKPKVFDIDELLKAFPLEERVYRLRCVEAWSMVVPWVGFPLSALLKRVEPTSRGKFVQFTTLHDPKQMPGQRPSLLGSGLDWPYVEGLRLDEAMHPLAILAVGLYGEVLPNQNGAPIRLVVPWKYGFKSIKSIVRIRLVEKQPATSWSKSAPGEYGFYANVNPEVHHPRWSQARERRIGEFLKRPTLPFNGYAEQVAHLYRGMDLRKFF